MGRYTDIAKSARAQVSFIPSSVNHEPAEETCFVSERKTGLYKMRENCLAAGHCLGLTVAPDCALFPIQMGWCRERTRSGRRRR